MNLKKGLIIGSIVFVVIVVSIVIGYYLMFGFSTNSFIEIGSGPLDFIYKRF